MKYVVVIPDGMADYALDSLGGKSPMAAADKKNMNTLAGSGKVGMCLTVPPEMTPESDTANLALLGYDPLVYSRGRSPLEAASMGIEMMPEDTAVRVNLVALSDNGEKYEDKIMLDHSSDEISTDEARVLIEAIEERFGTDYRKFYTGVSYRHCMIWKNCFEFDDFSRPHDIIGKQIGKYLPYKEQTKPMLELMKESFDFLNNHPVNIERAKKGLKKANSLWPWSPGKKAFLPSFEEKFGLKGAVVCAVDLIKGIGVCAGMEVPKVKGATGNFDTDYSAKAKEAVSQLLEKGKDLVYVHIEAPDECGHRGELETKIKSVELIDEKVIGHIVKELEDAGEDFRLLVLPDHPTPIPRRTHTRGMVPFFIYDSRNGISDTDFVFSEKTARNRKLRINKGCELMSFFLEK
jgi:2,3-bisphosphoglycerate-independent phosphoglycerate mutase